VYFLVHVFDRVSSGRGQKAESGESHYQKRRAQIANWRRLSGARVCALRGAEVGKNGNDGYAAWQTLLLRPFAFHCAADVSITFKLPLLQCGGHLSSSDAN
jgi:hypothetical protein